MKWTSILVILAILVLALSASAKDDKKTQPSLNKKNQYNVGETTFSHKIGRLWQQVTNHGRYGDESYSEPNFEWPGGSGNIYGWRTSLWIGAIVDSLGYVSSGENEQFTPLDSIHVKHAAEGSLSAEDTYTSYTDVNPPNASGVHKNLGVTVVERTYQWDQSYNQDFIIVDYWIKYTVRDRNNDGVINAFDSTLTGVYVGCRMDCDVSGFDGSGTISALWDQDDLVGYDSTNKFIYLYDGVSPTIVYDTIPGNPDPTTHVLRSPGYIGIRMLYYDSTHFQGTYTGKPTMATPCWRYQEPTTAQPQYEFLRQGIAPNQTQVRDYRAIEGVGPFDIPTGDSIHVVIAWVAGYGLQASLQNSQIAQTMFDNNYSAAPAAPAIPKLTMATTTSNGIPATALRWQSNAESSQDPLTHALDFGGYAVYRMQSTTGGGTTIWDTLAVYVKDNLVNPAKDTSWIGRPFLKSWPPPTVVVGTDTLYQYLDLDQPNGLIYTYAVTAFDQGDSLLGLGRLENQIGIGRPSTQVFMPNATAAPNTAKIRVVPNPFMGSSAYNNPNPIDTNPWINRIRFINLPKDATVSIFTLAGDLVRTLHAGAIVYVSRDATVSGDFSGVAEWDLVTKNNQEAVSGLYIYVVQSSTGTFTGKFVIMR